MPVKDLSHPEMIAKSADVVRAYTPEQYAYLLSLFPTPEKYAADHERYEASYAASLKGDPEKVKACEADRILINESLAMLEGLAKVVAVKDPSVCVTLGVVNATVVKAAPTVLTAPGNFRVMFDPTGQIVASVTRVMGAKGYQVWSCDGDPSLEANWRLVASSTTCRGIVIKGLRREKPNWLRVRAMRGNGAGPWSNYVSLSPS